MHLATTCLQEVKEVKVQISNRSQVKDEIIILPLHAFSLVGEISFFILAISHFFTGFHRSERG